MKLTVFTEARFFQTPDGFVWSKSGSGYFFWRRYLDVFDSVEVVARVKNVEKKCFDFTRSDGDDVSFISMPSYVGPLEYLKKYFQIHYKLKELTHSTECILLRVPGQLSNHFYYFLKSKKIPFGVEVVGDPYDVFAPGSVKHAFRFFFRWLGYKSLKVQCNKAIAAAYVTSSTLQKRYPNTHFETNYSSIELTDDAFHYLQPKSFNNNGIINIVFIGSLAQLYKAPDVLIDAISICISKGFKISLKIIGDGKYRDQLQRYVLEKGLNESIQFLGQLPAGGPVRRHLIDADLFVLPSKTEGLPRAMIEAMACGLPCIGTNVGGIPELLPSDYLVKPGDPQSLASKIIEVISDPDMMRSMSLRNLETAKEYRSDILQNRRFEFYTYLKKQTEFWINGKL